MVEYCHIKNNSAYLLTLRWLLGAISCKIRRSCKEEFLIRKNVVHSLGSS